jgi:hypothetical protein
MTWISQPVESFRLDVGALLKSAWPVPCRDGRTFWACLLSGACSVLGDTESGAGSKPCSSSPRTPTGSPPSGRSAIPRSSPGWRRTRGWEPGPRLERGSSFPKADTMLWIPVHRSGDPSDALNTDESLRIRIRRSTVSVSSPSYPEVDLNAETAARGKRTALWIPRSCSGSGCDVPP